MMVQFIQTSGRWHGQMRRLLMLFALGAATSAAPAKAPTFDASTIQQSGLNAEQAKQVLAIVLRHEKYRLDKRGMGIEGPSKGDPDSGFVAGYYSFGLEYESAKYGATQVLGMYAVSKFTGDVWEVNLCKRYDFPALKGIQAAIMRKTGKSLADESSARRGLGCTDE